MPPTLTRRAPRPWPVRTALVALLVSAVALAACSETPAASTSGAPLATFDAGAFRERLADTERPMVVNAWGSWCPPCRSEAPLIAEAHRQYGDRVEFLGVAINDTQAGASGFIEEFGLTYENLLDPTAEVRSELGGIGAPVTWFVAPGGAIVDTHLGIIDANQLAVAIDELLAGL